MIDMRLLPSLFHLLLQTLCCCFDLRITEALVKANDHLLLQGRDGLAYYACIQFHIYIYPGLRPLVGGLINYMMNIARVHMYTM